jgi:hypothetical protein
MSKLKPVMLQQHKEEGGEWRHEPCQGVRREVDEVARMGERQHPVLHLRIIPWGLPPDHFPHHLEVILKLVAQGGRSNTMTTGGGG